MIRSAPLVLVGPRLQSPGFVVLMITKYMWLFVLIKFKCLSIFQGFKDSRKFLPLKEVLKTQEDSNTRVKLKALNVANGEARLKIL